LLSDRPTFQWQRRPAGKQAVPGAAAPWRRLPAISAMN